MANRNVQKFGQAAVTRRLGGLQDHRGPVGILSRGKNIYNGVSSAAHRGGGPQFGRPKGARDRVPNRSAVTRRIAQRARRKGVK